MLRFLKEILFHTSNVLIWGLILAILFVVLISVIIIFPGLRELWNHAYGSIAFVNAVNSDRLKYLSSYLSSFVVSSAALVALLTYRREKKRMGKELALSAATRWNQALKEFYCRLIAKGKKHKVALTACMRKMLITLNAMLKNNQTYNPKLGINYC